MFKFKEFLGKKIRSLFQRKIDESEVEKLEQLFYEADLGSELSMELTEKVRKLLSKQELTGEEAIAQIQKELLAILNLPPALPITSAPHVIMVVGTNGNGKTTSIAKLAYLYKQQAKKVLIASGDTFRAGAIDQLEVWAKRLDVELVRGTHHGDAASVVFDALQAAMARGIDILLIDTAGRLHTKGPLMQELEKMGRVIKKVIPAAPHETLLVLDGTVGSNAIEQAITFHKHTPLTGLILTKMDGTAKGGAICALQRKIKLPIKYVGIGEGLADLQPFDPQQFTQSLFQ